MNIKCVIYKICALGIHSKPFFCKSVFHVIYVSGQCTCAIPKSGLQYHNTTFYE